jgi:hypothetical protein
MHAEEDTLIEKSEIKSKFVETVKQDPSVPIKRVYNTVVARSRRFRIEFGIPNEIIQKYSETAWKFGLCHFLGRKKMRKFGLCNFFCRKKCGKLDFIIFIGKKSTESWTLSFLMVEKFAK